MTKIAVIGLWHLGSVVSACLADKGYDVVGVDKQETVEKLNQGIAPIFETDLNDLLRYNVDYTRKLHFTTDMVSAVKDADFIFITYDALVDDQDEVYIGEIRAIFDSFRRCSLKDGVTIVVSSQVPVGTCNIMKEIIEEWKPELKFDIAYSPENLRLGKAVDCYMRPDRIIIGADNEETLGKVSWLFSQFTSNKIGMSVRSAEMTKHALNTYLAGCISFINEIGNLCDLVGADASDVSRGLLSDSRVSDMAPLRAGLGFSGGHLARDLKILKSLGSRLKYETHYVDGVLKVNEEQNKSVVRGIKNIYGYLDGLDVGVLGLTYKAGTSTLHRSASMEIIDELVRKGAVVKAHDPKAETRSFENFGFCEDPYEVAVNSDVLLIMTEWPEYRKLDFKKIKSIMKTPNIFDVKNILNEKELTDMDFKYLTIGRGNSKK